MPFLKQITTRINEAVLNAFPVHFVPVTLFNIAYPYPEVDHKGNLSKNIPAIIDSESGEGLILIDANEDEAVKIYHRIVTNTYQHVPAKTGSGYIKKWTADMYMVVIAARKKVKISAEDLEQMIVNSFNVGASNTNVGITNLFVLPYQSDMDFISVFRGEFQQIPYFLKPTQILFKIKYRVTADVDPNCFNSLN